MGLLVSRESHTGTGGACPGLCIQSDMPDTHPSPDNPVVRLNLAQHPQRAIPSQPAEKWAGRDGSKLVLSGDEKWWSRRAVFFRVPTPSLCLYPLVSDSRPGVLNPFSGVRFLAELKSKDPVDEMLKYPQPTVSDGLPPPGGAEAQKRPLGGSDTLYKNSASLWIPVYRPNPALIPAAKVKLLRSCTLSRLVDSQRYMQAGQDQAFFLAWG